MTDERCEATRNKAQCFKEKGHKGEHRYKCAGKYCPGLPWPASEIGHPTNCETGGIRE